MIISSEQAHRIWRNCLECNICCSRSYGGRGKRFGIVTFMTTTSLRTRKHIMIINLIVTDLLSGAAGTSSTLYYLLKPSDIAFYVLQTLNIFPKAASLFTLGVIAVERMHAIVWPIRHRVLGTSIYKVAWCSFGFLQLWWSRSRYLCWMNMETKSQYIYL